MTIPYDLKRYGPARLGKLDLKDLRELCHERKIDIAEHAHGRTCVEKLLEWKEDYKTSSPRKEKPKHETDEERNIPRDLHGWGRARLETLDQKELRELCHERKIKIAKHADENTCIDKLLEWKETGGIGPSVEAKIEADDDAQLFRADTLPTVGAIFEQNRKDLYTGWNRKKLESTEFFDLGSIVQHYEENDPFRAVRIERDHIVECQVIAHVWNKLDSRKTRSRSAVAAIRDATNDVENLNNTLGVINYKKEWGFTKFLQGAETNDQKEGLRDFLIERGIHRHVTRSICTQFETASNTIADKVQKLGDDVHDAFSDELVSMLGFIRLE